MPAWGFLRLRCPLILEPQRVHHWSFNLIIIKEFIYWLSLMLLNDHFFQHIKSFNFYQFLAWVNFIAISINSAQCSAAEKTHAESRGPTASSNRQRGADFADSDGIHGGHGGHSFQGSFHTGGFNHIKSPFLYWLVVSNMFFFPTIYFSPFHIWDNKNPSYWLSLHNFSRWWNCHHQTDGYPLVNCPKKPMERSTIFSG